MEQQIKHDKVKRDRCEYYQANKEKYRLNYQKNKEKIRLRNAEKKSVKKSNQDKTELQEYNASYYNERRDAILKHRHDNPRPKERFVCACGSEFAKTHLTRHIKSNKHLRYVDKQNIKLTDLNALRKKHFKWD